MSRSVEKVLRAGRFLLFLIAWLRLEAPWSSAADAGPGLEYKVKAGYLFNFAKFVEWPHESLASPGTPLVVGILDNGEASPIISSVLAGKQVDGHPLQVKSVTAENLQGLHILFVTRASGKTPEMLNEKLGSSATLLVGESESFAERGGMFGFQIEKDSIRLLLNLDRTSSAGLKVSSQLFSVARVVKSAKTAN